MAALRRTELKVRHVMTSIFWALAFIFIETHTSFANVVNTDPTAYLEVGRRAQLPCSVDSKVYIVSWLKQTSQQEPELIILVDSYFNPGQTVGPGYESGSFNINDKFSLIIADVKIQDEGKYICEVTDLISRRIIRNHTVVSIFESPKEPFPVIQECIMQNDDVCQVDDSQTNLTCFVDGFYPNITLKFLDEMHSPLKVQSNVSVSDDGTMFKSITLNIPTSSSEFYNCVASDIPGNSGNRTKTVYISSRDLPTTASEVVNWKTIAIVLAAIAFTLFITCISLLYRLFQKIQEKRYMLTQTLSEEHKNHGGKCYEAGKSDEIFKLVDQEAPDKRRTDEIPEEQMECREYRGKVEMEELRSRAEIYGEENNEMKSSEGIEEMKSRENRQRDERQREEIKEMRSREERLSEEIKEMKSREERLSEEIEKMKSREKRLIEENEKMKSREKRQREENEEFIKTVNGQKEEIPDLMSREISQRPAIEELMIEYADGQGEDNEELESKVPWEQIEEFMSIVNLQN